LSSVFKDLVNPGNIHGYRQFPELQDPEAGIFRVRLARPPFCFHLSFAYNKRYRDTDGKPDGLSRIINRLEFMLRLHRRQKCRVILTLKSRRVNFSGSRPPSGRAFAGALAGLCMAAAGLYAMLGESSAFFTRSGNMAERLAPLYDGSAHVSHSTYANKLLMRDCDEALSSVYARLLPQEQRQAGARSCLALAKAVNGESPADGLAWLIQAKAQDALGDMPAASAALRRSQEASAGEGWLAVSRIRFLLPRLSQMGEAAQAVITSDVTLLAMSWNGPARLAELYKQQGDHGQALIGIIDKLPDDAKARFLRQLRAMSRQDS
jgi:hypothetical protein